jgi:DNA-binding MarR family transcriptional regulator
MQRLADELAAEGLVEFIDNPRHRRSKVVRLTHKRDARYRQLNARLLEIGSTMSAGMSDEDRVRWRPVPAHLATRSRPAVSYG